MFDTQVPGVSDQTNPFGSLPLAVKVTLVFQYWIGLPAFAQRRPTSQMPLVPPVYRMLLSGTLNPLEVFVSGAHSKSLGTPMT